MEQKKLSGAKSPKATKPIQAPSGKTDTKLKKQARAHQPLLFAFLGFVAMAVGIIIRPKGKNSDKSNE